MLQTPALGLGRGIGQERRRNPVVMEEATWAPFGRGPPTADAPPTDGAPPTADAPPTTEAPLKLAVSLTGSMQLTLVVCVHAWQGLENTSE